jgi:hypothetical protein
MGNSSSKTNFGENIWTNLGKKNFLIIKGGQTSAGPTGSGFDPTGPLKNQWGRGARPMTTPNLNWI